MVMGPIISFSHLYPSIGTSVWLLMKAILYFCSLPSGKNSEAPCMKWLFKYSQQPVVSKKLHSIRTALSGTFLLSSILQHMPRTHTLRLPCRGLNCSWGGLSFSILSKDMSPCSHSCGSNLPISGWHALPPEPQKAQTCKDSEWKTGRKEPVVFCLFF